MKLIYSLTPLCLAFSLASSPLRAADPAASEKDKPVVTKTAPKAEKPLELTDPVAVVDGVEIKKAELTEAFDAMLAQAGKKAEEINNSQRLEGYTAILNDLVIDKIILKASAKQEVTPAEADATFEKVFKGHFKDEAEMNAEIKKAGQTVEKIKGNIRLSLQEQKWIESQIAGKVAVIDAEIQDFYNKHPEFFNLPETVRASHILIALSENAKPEEIADKEKKAKGVAEKAKKGEDFAKLAKENSEDPGSKENGGDLDFFPHDQMVPEFADAAFKMKKGEISDPVKSSFGFHIIKVTDKKEARIVPIAEVKEKIVAHLKIVKQKQLTEDLVKSLREKATVKINLPVADKTPEAALPPPTVEASPAAKP